MLSLLQGAKLVALARNALDTHFSFFKKLKIDKKLKQELSSTHGGFVALYKKGQLRCSNGMVETALPLYEFIPSAVEFAAFKDNRFTPIEKKEIPELLVEISILSKPKRLDVRNPEDYLNKIRLGKDGILVRSTFTSGFVLPQVALSQQWDALTFLRNACLKAQIHPDDWQDFDKVRVYTFQCQVFSESSPQGEIIQLM
jgi:uncharacterized protein (TIGR00296 family)